MIKNGYVILPRNLAKKAWFSENSTLRLYIVLLFNAAFKDTETGGITVKRGQYVTSYRKLAAMTNMGEQQVRTALKHLEAAGEITRQTTLKYSVVTLKNAFPEALSDRPDNTRANARVNTQANTRSSKIKEEDIKEKGNEEVAASPTAACSSENGFSSITREELAGKYGEAAVVRYEAKFRQWASTKAVVNAKLYPTIAKWLEEDSASAAGCPTPSKPPAPPQSRRSSVNTALLKERIMENYRKAAYNNGA